MIFNNLNIPDYIRLKPEQTHPIVDVINKFMSGELWDEIEEAVYRNLPVPCNYKRN